MGSVNKEAILSKTHYGIGIYVYILRSYYPEQTVLSLSGRTCLPAKNPFNADKSTLNIFIEKENVLGNALDREFSCQREQNSNSFGVLSSAAENARSEFARHSDSEISCQRVQSLSSLVTMPSAAEIACHYDTQNAIPAGDAFDFAELHYKQSGDELLQTINKEMNLQIGEKFNFHGNNKKNVSVTQPQQSKSLPFGEVGGASFSFFKAPIRNTIPHKSISLLDAYNYIVGEYAKQRTEKLRGIKDPKQARQFKASTFDYCTFSGMFQTRNDKALISHSGLLCIDFDHLSKTPLASRRGVGGEVDLLRKQLLQDEYFETQLLFVSPSGDGIKWIISISPPVGDLGGFSHSNYFAAVANYILQTYGVEVDKSGRDISRACFLPHDPQAYINPLFKPSTL